MRYAAFGALVALGLLLATRPTVAHHSFAAEFDIEKKAFWSDRNKMTQCSVALIMRKQKRQTVHRLPCQFPSVRMKFG